MAADQALLGQDTHRAVDVDRGEPGQVADLFLSEREREAVVDGKVGEAHAARNQQQQSRDPAARLIEEVSDLDSLDELDIGVSTSPRGSGGMRSKVVAAEMATAAGIPATKTLEDDKDNPSTVLGPDAYASPVDMANAYATFAAGGKAMPLHTIKEVRGPDGKVLWSDSSLKPKQAFPPEIANMVNYVLQDVVKDGTGTGAKELGREVAGKTGTAGGVALEDRKKNKECDGCKEGSATLTSWWTGYTPQLSTSVLYRAGNSGESDLDPYSDDPAFFGGNWPLKTWLAYMSKALEGVEEENFAEPDEDAIKDSPTPTFTPSKTPTITPSNTPAPPTNTPATPTITPPPSQPTKTPTNTPTKKPTKTPVWPPLPTGGTTEPTTTTPKNPGGGQ